MATWSIVDVWLPWLQGSVLVCGCHGNLVPCWCVVAVVTEMEEMKRQMEEELRKKEEELENLSKTYEQRMAEASQANKVA